MHKGSIRILVPRQLQCTLVRLRLLKTAGAMELDSPEITLNIIRSLRERILSDPNISPESRHEFTLVTARLMADYINESLSLGTEGSVLDA